MKLSVFLLCAVLALFVSWERCEAVAVAPKEDGLAEGVEALDDVIPNEDNVDFTQRQKRGLTSNNCLNKDATCYVGQGIKCCKPTSCICYGSKCACTY